MKKQSFKLGFKKVMVLAGLAATLSFTTFTSAKASEKTKSAISYVGTNDNGIVFNVKYDNAARSKFDLIIRTDAGETVFQQSYKDTNFDKKIVLAKEPGEAHLTFILKTATNTFTQSYDISTTTHTVEDVVVKSSK